MCQASGPLACGLALRLRMWDMIEFPLKFPVKFEAAVLTFGRMG